MFPFDWLFKLTYFKLNFDCLTQALKKETTKNIVHIILPLSYLSSKLLLQICT